MVEAQGEKPSGRPLMVFGIPGSSDVDLGSRPTPFGLSPTPPGVAGEKRTGGYVRQVLRSVYETTTATATATATSSEDGGGGNATPTDGVAGRGLIGVLMGSAAPSASAGEAGVVASGNASSSSSYIIREALSFTLEEAGAEGPDVGGGGGGAGAGAAGGAGGGAGAGGGGGDGGEVVVVVGGGGGVGLQRLLGGSGAPYLSALTHNLSHSHQGLSNATGGRDVLLFANYPSHLLDFAAFCCVLFIVLGVPGNLITIIALVKCKKVHNATAVFIINLTLSDLMFGLFNLPLAASLFGHRAWVHTRFLCLLFPILRYGLLAVSVFTVLAITINRYVMIAHPRLYHRLYTRTWLALMVVATWVGAFGALVPTLLELWGTFGLDPAIGSCTILPDRAGNSPKEFLFLFAFVLPCVAICVCYARIFFIVHRADRKSHSHGQRLLKVNGGRQGRDGPPTRPEPPQTLQTLHLETLVKLSSSSNSVQVEILEPGEKSRRERKGERKRDVDGGGESSKEEEEEAKKRATRTSSLPDAGSLLKAEANGFSGPASDESVGASDLAVCSPIRICPPSGQGSPASEKSSPSSSSSSASKTTRGAERRPSTISGGKGGGGTFSQLRGTFRKTRAGSFIARQPTLSAKDRRLLKMILVIFLSFVACYLPITLVKTFSKDDNPILNILGLLLIYLTTCINPIIYVVMSSEYRQAYVSLLTCRRDVDPTNRSVTKIS